MKNISQTCDGRLSLPSVIIDFDKIVFNIMKNFDPPIHMCMHNWLNDFNPFPKYYE